MNPQKEVTWVTPGDPCSHLMFMYRSESLPIQMLESFYLAIVRYISTNDLELHLA